MLGIRLNPPWLYWQFPYRYYYGSPDRYARRGLGGPTSYDYYPDCTQRQTDPSRPINIDKGDWPTVVISLDRQTGRPSVKSAIATDTRTRASMVDILSKLGRPTSSDRAIKAHRAEIHACGGVEYIGKLRKKCTAGRKGRISACCRPFRVLSVIWYRPVESDVWVGIIGALE